MTNSIDDTIRAYSSAATRPARSGNPCKDALLWEVAKCASALDSLRTQRQRFRDSVADLDQRIDEIEHLQSQHLIGASIFKGVSQ